MKKLIVILFLVLANLSYSGEYLYTFLNELNYYEFFRGEPPEPSEGYGYILNKENEDELVFYFKLFPLKSKITSMEEKMIEKVLAYFTLENIDNYYSSFNKKHKYDVSPDENYGYGKWIIKKNSKQVELHWFSFDENGEKQEKKYVKSVMDSKNKYSSIILNLLTSIDLSNERGAYMSPTSLDEVTIFTSKKIISKSSYSLSIEERRLYKELLKLFKDELPKDFFEEYNDIQERNFKRMSEKFKIY